MMLGGLVITTAASAEAPNLSVVVIANPSIPNNDLELGGLKMMFLKKKRHWRGGSNIHVIHASAGSQARLAFLEDVLGMSEDQEKDYWDDQRIRGGLREPVEFGDNVAAVSRIRDSVSYITQQAFAQGVKMSAKDSSVELFRFPSGTVKIINIIPD